MKPVAALLSLSALAGLLPGAAAAPEGISRDNSMLEIARRALPNAPNGYAPAPVDCPQTRPSVRNATKVSSEESQWLDKRHPKTTMALKDFFGHVEIPGFDAAGYIDTVSDNATNVPKVGIAVSGGGYRALMNGAGTIKAFDSRTENATAKGHLGGLLQSATYLTGLSGGGWLVGSIYMNNFSSVPSLQTQEEGAVWQFGNSIFEGPANGPIQVVDSAQYFSNIKDAVSAKSDAGFATTITDYWGRALSYQLINSSHGGPDYTWSSISETSGFQDADMPMPVVIADGRYPGGIVVGGNATIFEFNPWEFGTFDPTVRGFIPIEFLGSKFVEGSLPQNESCIRGFDNAGYVMGTSSSIFNSFLLNVNSTALPDIIKDAARSILREIGQDNEDIALYKPNPFYHYHNSSSPFFTEKSLDLVDGGLDGQNIPLHPLIQPARHVDVIFAVDSSADTNNNWPDGSALVNTYERSLNTTGIGSGTKFPTIPGQSTFFNKGLNTRPVFFGCDSSNITGPSPLVVYLPNYPYVTFSNVSTFDPAYNDTQRDAIILNGYDVATMGNSTRDSNWSTCVGCAVLSRSFERTNTTVPEACKKCFDSYCWDGSTDTSNHPHYAPDILMTAINLASAAGTLVPSMLTTLVAATIALLVLV